MYKLHIIDENTPYMYSETNDFIMFDKLKDTPYEFSKLRLKQRPGVLGIYASPEYQPHFNLPPPSTLDEFRQVLNVHVLWGISFADHEVCIAAQKLPREELKILKKEFPQYARNLSPPFLSARGRIIAMLSIGTFMFFSSSS